MRILLLSLVIITSFAQELTIKDPRLFNPEFLSKYDQVADLLVKEKEFQRVTFNSADGIRLAGLARIKPQAPYSIICCAGFLPGRKEGLATLIELLPPEVNILFFDARGHGSSSGSFWTSLHQYGLHEKEDIFGAIECINTLCKEKKPIVLHGTCAGAYHAATAALDLTENKDQLAGLILDSGFTSPLECMDVPGAYCKEKLAPKYAKKYFYKNDSKEQVKKRYITHILAAISSLFFNSLAFCVRPFLKTKSEKLDLFKKMQSTPLTCPTLFVHAENDVYSKITPIKSLAQLVPNRSEWWIADPKAEHALNLIKCKEEYYAQLHTFLKKILDTINSDSISHSKTNKEAEC